MKTYEVTESLRKVYSVEAESKDEAYDKVFADNEYDHVEERDHQTVSIEEIKE